MSDHNNHIIKELQEISPLLANIQRKEVLSVPDGYFKGFRDALICKMQSDKALTDVPENYFLHLPESIMTKIHHSSDDTIRQAVGSSEAFTVDEHYFHDFPGVVMSRIKKEGTAQKSTKQIFFIRYALAAAITGILGLQLFSLFNRQENGMEVEQVVAAANVIIADNSFEQVLNSLEDDEIESYLEANGHDVQAALVAAAAEKKELPEEMDYIIEDNTLSEFLKENQLEDALN